MDINCTDNCEYQREGKCDLAETPAVLISEISEEMETESDCPYFIKRVNM